MNDTPASGERVQKYVFNFKIYRFAKKRPNYPILPYYILQITPFDFVREVGGLKSG